MAPRVGFQADRHFNGLNTRLVVTYLTARHHPGTLEAVMRRAGESRPVPVLLDDSSWSSYEQFRRLLEATADEVGIDVLPDIAPVASNAIHAPAETVDPLQGLGSPQALIHESVLSGATMGMSVIREIVGGEPVGSDGYRLRSRLRDGFAPFRALCAYTKGLVAVTPTVFGLPRGDVVEQACQCDGSPFCQFVVRWRVTGSVEEAVGALQARVRVLQDRIDSFESTVAELVSNDDIAGTLTRIADTAARVLRAPAHALVLDDPGLAPEVLAAATPEGPVVAAARQADPSGDADVLVAPVTSGARRYGRLAIFERRRVFRPHERQALISYARLAATALDSATAVAESQRQAKTASALLHLSTALGQVMTSDEMAEVLARAVPEVIDCDRAAVILGEPGSGTERIAAVHGYPDELREHLDAPDAPLPPSGSGDEIAFLRVDETPADEARADLVHASGSVATAIVPMVVDGVTAGRVVAAVTERPERLGQTTDLEERLRGIAALGSAAVRNGQLVDTIRHQATHDALTGLPNRVLILDRLNQLLKRSGRTGLTVAVLFVDLDGFKEVNDTLGHGVGDRLLREAAERLRWAVREADTVGRLGGDEFVVVVDGDGSGTTPEEVAERILSQLRRPFPLSDGRTATITASIGIAAGAAGEAEDLLRDADVALYEAKGTGKSRAVRFLPVMGRYTRRRFERNMELQVATRR